MKEKNKRMPRDPDFEKGSIWPVPQLDLTLCDGCELCIKVCPSHALQLREELVVVAFPERCDFCGLCEQVCPQKAIERTFEIVFP
jgi:electron transport complex protein RnfB